MGHHYRILYKPSRILIHILFWLISLAANAYAFKISSQLSWLDFYYACFSHICLIAGAYFNMLVLIPLLFQHQKYLWYTISSLVCASLMGLLYLLTFNQLVDWVMPEYFFVSQFNELEVFIYVLAYLSFTTLLNLSESWFKLQENNKLMLLREKENIDNQLKALKSQINPHFLFNSLNVIYSEALKKTDQVPEIVIKLSDILRYVLYKSKNDTIKLSEETSLIEDYIQLQKYRIEESTSVSFESNYHVDHHIAPMLFLPLIENSFKHGAKGDLENTFVHLKLISDNTRTSFYIENNKGKASDANVETERGIGLDNVKKRLLLLYPNRHEMKIVDEKKVFKVTIILNHQIN